MKKLTIPFVLFVICLFDYPLNAFAGINKSFHHFYAPLYESTKKQEGNLTAIPQIDYPPISPTATTYYVSSEIGSDANNGMKQSTPFHSIKKALEISRGGDVIYVAPGSYKEFIVITKGGTPHGYTTLLPLPGSAKRPIINPDMASFKSSSSVIDIQTSYVRVSGFNVSCIADPTNPKTVGIAIHGKISQVNGNNIPLTHHIFLHNNVVHDNPAGGISASHSDYITIYQNIVYGNSKLAPNQTSGISLWGLYNFDDLQGYHNLIVGNQSFGNVVTVKADYKTPDGSMHRNNCTTDGNGIIIDDSRRTQQKDKTPYRSETLVYNNLVYNNGGRGIVIYQSDNVSVINNTLYQNMSSPLMCNPGEQGDMVAKNAGNVKFINNIIQSAGISNAAVQENTNRDCVWKNNLIIGDVLINKKKAPYSSLGAENLTGRDAMFKNPSVDPSRANFSLSDKSPALNQGASLPKFFGNGANKSVNVQKKANLGATL